MLELQTRVRIRPHAEYRGKFTDETGTIFKSYGSVIGVKLDNFVNESSNYGVFWFKPNSLDFMESEDFIMVDNGIVAGVKFGGESDKEYLYALYTSTVHPGDFVVVNTGHHGMGVAQVTTIKETMSTKSIQYGREIICPVELDAYNDRQAKKKRIAELKVKMDERVRQLQQTVLYDFLSEKDPELAVMLQEFKTLLG